MNYQTQKLDKTRKLLKAVLEVSDIDTSKVFIAGEPLEMQLSVMNRLKTLTYM